MARRILIIKISLPQKKKIVNFLDINFFIHGDRYKLLISVTTEFKDEDGGRTVIGDADNCKLIAVTRFKDV